MRPTHAVSGITWVHRGDVGKPARRAAEIEDLEQLFTLDLPDPAPERGVRDEATGNVATRRGGGGVLASSSTRLPRVADILVAVGVGSAGLLGCLIVLAVTAAVRDWPVILGISYWGSVTALVLYVVSWCAWFIVRWMVGRGHS